MPDLFPTAKIRETLVAIDLTLAHEIDAAICEAERDEIDAARDSIGNAITQLDDAALARLETEGR